MTTSNHFKDNAASADTSELTRLDNQLCFAFYSVSNALTRMYGPVLAPLELTYPQYLVMLVLWERAPRGMGELSSQLGMDFGTLSPLVKRLEKSGRVTRTRDPEDERRVIVGLTKAGEALREQAAHGCSTAARRQLCPAAAVARVRCSRFCAAQLGPTT